jgi:glyoxylase-like metal-dependent hydrolase (beta-lactamase superfamily II)
MMAVRTLLAPNPSAMTLDGTRTYVVGRERVAIIDPGPAIEAHIAAIAAAVAEALAAMGAGVVTIALTHDHADHAEAASPLAERLGGARILAAVRGTLDEGTRIETDAGPLRALHTPGHSPDHFSFHLESEAAVFCGDLMAGGLDTSWVGAPDGDLDAYLGSLERLRALRPRVILPAHGEPVVEPTAAIDRYVAHRNDRERQVLAALARGAAPVAAIAEGVYGGTIPPELREYAAAATTAYLVRLERAGRVRRRGEDGWEIVA